jgi:DNA helicase HerA-like ATPase
MSYKFNQGHTTVIGMTQNGKTYTVSHLLESQKRGVLFFNAQMEDLQGYIKVDKTTKFSIILKLLKKGQKINYFPSSRMSEQQNEISFLIEQLFENGHFNKKNFIYFVVDEAHLFKKKSLEQVCRIATGGLRFGIHGVFLSQRPANLDNTIMTQSTDMLIFFCSMESQYFKNYSIPIQQIIDEITKHGKYSFCSYNFVTVTAYDKI